MRISNGFEARLTTLQPALSWTARRLRRGSRAGQGLPEVDDLIQETIARLLAAGRSGTGVRPSELAQDALRRFAIRTLTNLWFDACRKRRESLAPVASPDPAAASAPEGVLAGLVELSRVVRAELNPEERAFLNHCVVTGSAAEAQREGGWPPGSPSNAAHKLAKLRRRLARRVSAPVLT